MLLTHASRRSRKLCRTILAVLGFDPKAWVFKVISAWDTSDWFCNMQVPRIAPG